MSRMKGRMRMPTMEEMPRHQLLRPLLPHLKRSTMKAL
jgi:hypothetical protein